MKFIINQNNYVNNNFVCDRCPGDVNFINYFYNDIDNALTVIRKQYNLIDKNKLTKNQIKQHSQIINQLFLFLKS